MEFRNITTFLKVAATQNFSKAAEQLGYSQSAVTIQMQQLERELGTKLFERIGKTVSLTAQGERFITYANEIVKVTNEAMAFAVNTSTPEGILRIGSVDSLATAVLPNLLLSFHRICPKVEIVIKTDTSDGLIEMIKSNEIDLFLTLDHKIYGTEWIRAIQREEDIVFVTSSNNICVSEKKQDLLTIAKEPFLLTEKGESYRYELERMLSEHDITIKPILEIGNTETIIHLLEEGMGFSFLPFFAVKKSIEQGILVQVETDAPMIRIWSQLLYHKNKWVTPQMKVFIAIAQKFFQ